MKRLLTVLVALTLTLTLAPRASALEHDDTARPLTAEQRERVSTIRFMHAASDAYALVALIEAIKNPPPPPEPEPAPAPQKKARPSSTSAGSVNSTACGGALPPCYVLQRESGGTNAENPVSSASGYWQIIDSTWAGYGGVTHASDAPLDVQNERAAQLWAGGAGCAHWSAC